MGKEEEKDAGRVRDVTHLNVEMIRGGKERAKRRGRMTQMDYAMKERGLMDAQMNPDQRELTARGG